MLALFPTFNDLQEAKKSLVDFHNTHPPNISLFSGTGSAEKKSIKAMNASVSMEDVRGILEEALSSCRWTVIVTHCQ